jgi:thiamine biosynthesis lipoprotein ApbE
MDINHAAGRHPVTVSPDFAGVRHTVSLKANSPQLHQRPNREVKGAVAPNEALASRVFQLIKRYEDLLTVNRAESQVMDINHP